MSEAVTIKIEKIFTKPAQKGISASFAANKVYFSAGFFADKDSIVINGISVKEGMTVTFEHKGQYKNIIPETFAVATAQVDNKSTSKPKYSPIIKVYGEVSSISNGAATVKNEDGNDIKVILGEFASDPKLAVGGRLTAKVDADGNIKSGFKAYDAAKPQQSEDEKDLAVRLGNAMTVANLLTSTADNLVDIAVDVLPKIDELRHKMRVAFPDMNEYGLGARVGQMVILAAGKTNDISSFIEVAEGLFIQLTDVERKMIAGGIVQNTNTAPAPTEPVAEAAQPEAHEPTIPQIDFDSDIPFAPIALQYRELLGCM